VGAGTTKDRGGRGGEAKGEGTGTIGKGAAAQRGKGEGLGAGGGGDNNGREGDVHRTRGRRARMWWRERRSTGVRWAAVRMRGAPTAEGERTRDTKPKNLRVLQHRISDSARQPCRVIGRSIDWFENEV